MRLKTLGGDLSYRQFTFPDGQRHFELQTWDVEDRRVTIETAIRNGNELFDVLLATDALREHGYLVSLDVRYLLGARMDRRISSTQPFTLSIVTRILNAAAFYRVRILDPHSAVSTTLLRATAIQPVHAMACVLAHFDPHETVIIAPDAGAKVRTADLVDRASRFPFLQLQGVKKRDPQTGRLSGFGIEGPSFVEDRVCLIVDDLCDGGGTFTGLAHELQRAGAASVDLFVTHGIFSKGGTLDGIRDIYTTDSYQGLDTMPSGPRVLHIDMDVAETAPAERKEALV